MSNFNERQIGRLKGAWRPDVRYSEGDLVEYLVDGVKYENWVIEDDVVGPVKKDMTAPVVRWWIALPEIDQTRERFPNRRRHSTNIGIPPSISIMYRERNTPQGEEVKFFPAVLNEEGVWTAPPNIVDPVAVIRNNDLRSYEGRRWFPSFWKNVTEEVTLHPSKYVRLQSINPALIDSYVLSKGIPDWYYYDLLGHFNSRSEIRTVVDLLRAVRGTIFGMEAYLNLVNLEATPRRMKPEERYEFTSKMWEKIREDWGLDLNEWLEVFNDERFEYFRKEFYHLLLNFEKEPFFPTKDKIVKGKAWSHEDQYANSDFQIGDYCFKNWYENEQTLEGYKGCSLYKCIAEVAKDNEGEPISPMPAPKRRGLFRGQIEERDDFWEWVYDVKNITYEEDFYKDIDDRSEMLYSNNYNPDNSMYRADVKNLINTENTIGGAIVRERDQQKYTCFMKRLFDFLIPAWIRFESWLYILDQRAVKMEHTHWANSIHSMMVNGVEPYTLTIRPFVGFNPWDPNWRYEGQLNHVTGWDTEILIEGTDGDFHEPSQVYTGNFEPVLNWYVIGDYTVGQIVYHNHNYYESLRTHNATQASPREPGTTGGNAYWKDITLEGVNSGKIFWSLPNSVLPLIDYSGMNLGMENPEAEGKLLTLSYVKVFRQDYLRPYDAALIKVQTDAKRKIKLKPVERDRTLLEGDDANGDYSNSEIRFFRDERDGNVYKCVKMPDGKWWFAENFRYMPGAALNSCVEGQTARLLNGYMTAAEACELYGPLYTQAGAINSAPEGWRVPSDEDWNYLVQSIGDNVTASKKLKAKSGWGPGVASFETGTDDYGWGALPGGAKSTSVLFNGKWASSTPQSGPNISHFSIEAGGSSEDNGWSAKVNTIFNPSGSPYQSSVRYVRDSWDADSGNEEFGWTGMAFHRWQLLDWYHKVPDWRLTGMRIKRRHIDMEPDEHVYWESLTHQEIETYEWKAYYFGMDPEKCNVMYPRLEGE